jgi:hypothetical protein
MNGAKLMLAASDRCLSPACGASTRFERGELRIARAQFLPSLGAGLLLFDRTVLHLRARSISCTGFRKSKSSLFPLRRSRVTSLQRFCASLKTARHGKIPYGARASFRETVLFAIERR